MLTMKELQKMLLAAAMELKAKSKYFCELDSVAGDGDHGLTIGRMADAIKQKVEANDAKDIKGLLDDIGMLCMGINGGSAGPLWGTVFSGMAEGAPADKTEVTSQEFCQMLAQAKADFEDISKAKLGDKTMVDALYPALMAGMEKKEIYGKKWMLLPKLPKTELPKRKNMWLNLAEPRMLEQSA